MLINKTALTLLVILISLFGCASKPNSSEAESSQAKSGALLAVINQGDDFKKANALLFKFDQPLLAFSVMEKVAKQQPQFAQFASQYAVFLGRDTLTREMYDRGRKPVKPADTIAVADLSAHDAIAEIVAAARAARIVIINETHDNQRQRAFSHLIAIALKTEGFSHLGLEAISPSEGAALKLNGPTTTTGFYTLDPFLADYILQAQAVGYEVFEYEEAYDRQIKGTSLQQRQGREQEQANNIKAVLDKHPNTKFLIHAGGGHGAKTLLPEGLAPMGRVLGEITGLQVLSIDQSSGSPQSKPSMDTALYQAVQSALLLDRPTVFKNKNNKFLAWSGYDISVFHPRGSAADGRGNWLTMNGYRKPVAIPLSAANERSLIRARALPLREKGLPMDQYLVLPTETEAVLYLPVGEYSLVREFESGTSLALGNRSVGR